MTERAAQSRIPLTVSAAVLVLLLTHAADLWSMIQLSQTLGVPLWMPYSALAVLYSLLFGLLLMILLGRRWARTLYTVLAVIGLLSIAGDVAGVTATEWLVVVLEVAALVLLHLPASRPWFAARPSGRVAGSGPPRGEA